MIQSINRLLGFLDLRVTRKSTYDKLVSASDAAIDIELMKAIDPVLRHQYLDALDHSRAQLRQDLFVLSQLGFKKRGFFVEFGATDGVMLSNTHLLENEFFWDGILAEPARRWHSALKKNRNCVLETSRCVWSKSGEILNFNEADEGEFSSIESFSDSDHNSSKRKSVSKYELETISLRDLLEQNNAPKSIDFLSIDTEGSEFEILNAFDFGAYRFNVITCEHNYTSNREKIHDLLVGHGYRRSLESLSRWDDWYVHRDVM